MKNAERLLRAELADGLQAGLKGLNKKHAQKLRKTVMRTANKLTKSFSKLRSKELKSREKKHRKATRASVENLVSKLHQILGQRPPDAGPVLG